MIKMGFLEHFQKHNQTLENIFQSIFWNATKHLKIFSFSKNIFTWKIFYTRKIFYIQPNAALVFAYVRSANTTKLTDFGPQLENEAQ